MAAFTTSGQLNPVMVKACDADLGLDTVAKATSRTLYISPDDWQHDPTGQDGKGIILVPTKIGVKAVIH